ncbi:hypothetical protein NPIL_295271 [Nephila pilipes]|uniref:Uncharacterized protein n=1 Tax=Nephila pilipes TaxID=299642 RepID=A0A8X6QBX1_NEPPI|nr:hypothetical protein NPIL_295271 [Nephila pilipes]
MRGNRRRKVPGRKNGKTWLGSQREQTKDAVCRARTQQCILQWSWEVEILGFPQPKKDSVSFQPPLPWLSRKLSLEKEKVESSAWPSAVNCYRTKTRNDENQNERCMVHYHPIYLFSLLTKCHICLE